MDKFAYLTYGLAVLLVFIGCKMLAHAAFDVKVPVEYSLSAIAIILGCAVTASLVFPPRPNSASHDSPVQLRPSAT
jgi:tellurite resistance protein TerC